MLAASVAAAVVGCGSLVSAAAPVFAADSSCNSVTVMKSGHIDAFHASASGSAVDLQMKWDNSPDKTKIFAPEKSVIDVPAKAWSSGVAQVIGHEAYMLPQVQEAGIPWVGWDMLGLGAGGYTSATIVLDKVAGPSPVRMFIGGNFGAKPTPLAAGKKADDYVVRSGDRLPDGAQLTHKHFYWTFDKAGVYTVVAHVEAKGKAGTTSTKSRTYTFAVGGATDQGCRVAKGLEEAGPATSPVPTPGSGGGDDSADTTSDTTVPVFHPGDTASLSANDFDPAGGDVTFTFENPRSKLASGKPNAKGAVSGLTGTIPAAAPLGDNAISVTQGKASVRLPVRIVARNTNPGGPAQGAPASTGASTSASGGGQSAAVSSSASTASSGEVCLPKKISRKISAAEARSQGLAETGAASAAGDLNLHPLMKDDRNSPPRWVNPESLTFGIGSAGRAVAPPQLAQFGLSGSVYMIGSTQTPGVPWVGANTQNDSVIANVNGAVTWRLESVSGPGKLVVFESGNLGQTVGNVWFTKPGDTHALGLHTHVHPNWIFSHPGTYRVRISETATLKSGRTVTGATTLTFIAGGAGNANDGHFDLGAEIKTGAPATGGKTVTKNADGSYTVTEVVGRTPSGKPCSLGSNLAKTGVGPMTPALAVFGLGLLVAGVGAVALRAQLRPVK